MKASELIENLIKLKEKYGDLDIMMQGGDYNIIDVKLYEYINKPIEWRYFELIKDLKW